MLSDVAIFVCLLAMLIALLRRKKQLKHIAYGSRMITAGMVMLVLASLSDVLFIGDVALFDVGLSSARALQIWTLIAYVPGLVAVMTGLIRILPAIGRLNEEITARKESERLQLEQNASLKTAIARAEAAERTLAEAIAAMTDAVAIFDADDKLITFNDAYAELCYDIRDELKPGLSYERLLRIRAERGIFPQAIGHEAEWVQQQLESRQTVGGPRIYELENGIIVRVTDNRTKLGGIVSIRTDITETRERQKALEDSRKKLEEAQSIAHIGNWMHRGMEGRHEWSDEVYRILGYEVGAVESRLRNFLSAVHVDDVERLKEVFNLSSEKREAFEIDFRIVRPSGELIYARIIGRLDMDENGQVCGASGTIQDITTQHLFEQELTQAKQKAEEGTRSKSLFLANMSHELRTPLNAVIGFSEVLAKEIYGPIENAKYREYADNIQSSGTHLLSLIDDILDYSRLEAGSVELQEAAFNIYDLARSTQTMLAAKAIEKSIKISISDSLDLCVIADERKLKQVLINLVNNAIKFTPERGVIKLWANTDSPQFFSLFVEDNGYGISQNEIENVLRPFGRAHHSVAKSIEGTGLGLPLAKSIVELHGGELKIANNGIEPGTIVEIRLPKSRLCDDIEERVNRSA